jgi:hypothetical protein
MIAVDHQTVGMAEPVEPLKAVCHHLEKSPAISIIGKDLYLGVTPRSDMINAAGEIYPQWSGHDRWVKHPPSKNKI